MANKILTPEQIASRKAYNAAWHAANKEKVAARVKEQRSKDPEKYRAMCAKWRSENKDKVIAYSVSYYEENKSRILAIKREQRPANAKLLAARFASWRIANREKVNSAHVAWCAANPEKRNAWRNAWTKANPEKKKAHHQNRRAVKKNAKGKLSADVAKALFVKQRGKCACCGKSLGDGYHLDHIMPLFLGGTNTDDNMQLLTPSCNMQKSKKHPIDFMKQRGFLL